MADLRLKELQRRREAAPEADRTKDIRRHNDLLELAQIPAGRRVFRRWLFEYRNLYYQGRQDDVYNLGLRAPGEALERELKGVLPRALFLEIFYPEKEE